MERANADQLFMGEEVVDRSTSSEARNGLRLRWWINENLHPPGFEAAGRGGQQISVLPAYDAVIVFTGGGFDAGKISPFLLRSMTASHSLPDNSGSLQELGEQLRLASQQTE